MSTNFKELGLIEPILLALFEEGYTTPTPIQAQSIPIILEGKDLLGCAQTGTGKTAAFTLPIIQLLLQHKPAERRKKIRTLIVTPTRELAIQIAENFEAYGRHTPLNCTVIFGGVGQGPQVTALRNGVDVVIATPGRLLDLMNHQTFTAKELQSFSLKNLLGKPAMLTLIHKTSQQGRQYCAIAGASKLPKGMTAPAKTANDQLYYEIEQGEAGQFNDMPEWLQEKIRASKEFATAAGKPTAIKAELDADGNQVPF